MFTRPRAVARPRLRVVVIHHAGGSAAAYFPLVEHLPPDWDPLLLDLPGRGKAHRLRPMTDMGRLAAWAAEHIRPWAPGGGEGPPLALFGHSLGAAVAHEAARLLAAAGSAPVWLGVSGRAAPRHPGPDGLPEGTLSDDELMCRLTELGGMHPRIDELPDFRERFLNLVRQDLRALADYRPAGGRVPLDVPLTAFGAREDTVVPPDSLSAWGAETTAGFRGVVFDGGHFHFLGQALPGFAARLVHEIHQAMGTARGSHRAARESSTV